jgi:hypothetical protein
VSAGKSLLAQPSEQLRTRLPGSTSSTSAHRFTPGGASGASSNSHCPPSLAYPERPGQELLRKAARQTWVVYAKRPLAGPVQVVRYFSRYTHRIALSNSRLVSYDGSEVSFIWRDRADGNRKKILTLRGREFARRFLWHVLPRGFVRIRHYGLLGNRTREKDLQRCRELLDAGQSVSAPATGAQVDEWVDAYQRIFGTDPLLCPACGEGRLTLRSTLPRAEPPPRAPPPEVRSP